MAQSNICMTYLGPGGGAEVFVPGMKSRRPSFVVPHSPYTQILVTVFLRVCGYIISESVVTLSGYIMGEKVGRWQSMGERV